MVYLWAWVQFVAARLFTQREAAAARAIRQKDWLLNVEWKKEQPTDRHTQSWSGAYYMMFREGTQDTWAQTLQVLTCISTRLSDTQFLVVITLCIF